MCLVAPDVVAPYTSFLYMLCMNFVTYVIMLNLFLLVTLQQFEDFDKKTENPIEKYNDMIECFKKAWNKYSSESDKGYRIKITQVSSFIMDLEGELINSIKDKKNLDVIKKYMLDLKLLK